MHNQEKYNSKNQLNFTGLLQDNIQLCLSRLKIQFKRQVMTKINDNSLIFTLKQFKQICSQRCTEDLQKLKKQQFIRPIKQQFIRPIFVINLLVYGYDQKLLQLISINYCLFENEIVYIIPAIILKNQQILNKKTKILINLINQTNQYHIKNQHKHKIWSYNLLDIINQSKNQICQFIMIQSSLKSFSFQKNSIINIQSNHTLNYKSIKIDIQRIERFITKAKFIKDYVELQRQFLQDLKLQHYMCTKNVQSQISNEQIQFVINYVNQMLVKLSNQKCQQLKNSIQFKVIKIVSNTSNIYSLYIQTKLTLQYIKKVLTQCANNYFMFRQSYEMVIIYNILQISMNIQTQKAKNHLKYNKSSSISSQILLLEKSQVVNQIQLIGNFAIISIFQNSHKQQNHKKQNNKLSDLKQNPIKQNFALTKQNPALSQQNVSLSKQNFILMKQKSVIKQQNPFTIMFMNLKDFSIKKIIQNVYVQKMMIWHEQKIKIKQPLLLLLIQNTIHAYQVKHQTIQLINIIQTNFLIPYTIKHWNFSNKSIIMCGIDLKQHFISGNISKSQNRSVFIIKNFIFSRSNQKSRSFTSSYINENSIFAKSSIEYQNTNSIFSKRIYYDQKVKLFEDNNNLQNSIALDYIFLFETLNLTNPLLLVIYLKKIQLLNINQNQKLVQISYKNNLTKIINIFPTFGVYSIMALDEKQNRFIKFTVDKIDKNKFGIGIQQKKHHNQSQSTLQINNFSAYNDLQNLYLQDRQVYIQSLQKFILQLNRQIFIYNYRSNNLIRIFEQNDKNQQESIQLFKHMNLPKQIRQLKFSKQDFIIQNKILKLQYQRSIIIIVIDKGPVKCVKLITF